MDKIVVNKPEVFKLQQRPLLTSGEVMVLIYNKDRSVKGQFQLTQDLEDMFCGQFKVYYLCHIDGAGILHVGEQVADEDW